MPTMPDELMFALAVDTSNLRPWEFWEANSAELYMVNSMKTAYHEGRQDARDQLKPETEKPSP